VIHAATITCPRFIRLPEVQTITGMSRSTIYRWMGEGRFPQQVKLAENTAVWVATEVADWASSLIADRDRQVGSPASA